MQTMEMLKISMEEIHKQVERVKSVFDYNDTFCSELVDAIVLSGMNYEQVDRQFSYIIQTWDRGEKYGKPQISDLVFTVTPIDEISGEKVGFVIRRMIDLRLPDWQEEIKPISRVLCQRLGISYDAQPKETRIVTRVGCEEYLPIIPEMHNELLKQLFVVKEQDGKVKYDKNGNVIYKTTPLGSEYSQEIGHFMGLSPNLQIDKVFYFDKKDLDKWYEQCVEYHINPFHNGIKFTGKTQFKNKEQ